MIVMPANNTGVVLGWLAGRFPGRIGHLYSPGGMTRLYDWMPYSLDNGRFAVWSAGRTWDEAAWLGMLDHAAGSGIPPKWVLVPDSVGNRDETLREWDRWCVRLQSYGWPLAIAVQDGMTQDDIPSEAAVVFRVNSSAKTLACKWVRHRTFLRNSSACTKQHDRQLPSCRHNLRLVHVPHS